MTLFAGAAGFKPLYKLLQTDVNTRVTLFAGYAGFRPLYKVLQRDMNSKETLFAGLAGLRGSVSLILAQAVITEDQSGDDATRVRHKWKKGGKEKSMLFGVITGASCLRSSPDGGCSTWLGILAAVYCAACLDCNGKFCLSQNSLHMVLMFT